MTSENPTCSPILRTKDKDTRRIDRASSAAIDEQFDTLKALVITGLTASVVGVTLLYIYLCMSKKNNNVRCTGIICAVSWTLAALIDIVGAGIQISRYKDSNNGIKHLEEMYRVVGFHLEGELMTPWAVICLGIGACWALVVGFVVALTTCGKRFNKTVIIYSELKDKEAACLMNEDEDD